ncbi:MAG: amino acid transporter, partial [Xanthomonadaceae bacterium]|nr:amino acid transporter [Xanthomonadaceae bacterium]
GQIIVLVVVALPVYLYYQYKSGWHEFGKQMKGAWWLVCYLVALAIVSRFGSTKFGGLGYLPYGWDLVVVAAIGLVFYLWGVRSGWRTPSVEAAQLEARVDPLAPLVPPDEEESERITGH